MVRTDKERLMSFVLAGVAMLLGFIFIGLFGLESFENPFIRVIFFVLLCMSWCCVCNYKAVFHAIVNRINPQEKSPLEKALEEPDLSQDLHMIKGAIQQKESIMHIVKMEFKDKRHTDKYIKYFSYLITTPQGIAVKLVDFNKELKLKFSPSFLGWYRISKIEVDYIKIDMFRIAIHKRDKKQESTRDFKKRKYQFFIEAISDALEYTQQKLAHIPEDTEDRILQGRREQMQKFLRKYNPKLAKVKKKAARKGYFLE